MLNSYFNAKLVDYDTIRVLIFSDIPKPDSTPIKLIKNDEEGKALNIVSRKFMSGIEIYECKCKEKIILGNEYYISIESFGIMPLMLTDVTSFSDFDKEYTYNNDDLGITYSKDKTVFKLWAPLASKVVLMVKQKGGQFDTFKMNRADKGVYTQVLDGDYEGYLYRYQITNSGLTFITTDPYAISSTGNGKDSIVVDLIKCNIDMHDDNLPFYKNYVDTIIYELSVRDFTIDEHTNIENKGKYLAFTETNKKTNGGHECGIDYLKSLNITHVQIMPIYDFKTIDEYNPSKSYNWGYDPQQYFCPEGSYCSNPDDPYARIIECKKMIASFHKAGIKVNMDVVFNHVYEYERSTLERIVPNYYFRRRRNGSISNGSGCGNDLDSQRPMVRNLIVDACKFWMDEYDIDGYRFDLMGIIDIETMNIIVEECRKRKKDAMIYGEGWNMNTALDDSLKTSINNAFKTPEIGFFNDSFRDIVRGPNGFDRSKEPGYMMGNTDYLEGFKFAVLGSCVDYCFKPRFASANQSINYVECHDNTTLYDKIKGCRSDLTEKRILHIINSINATVAISFGVPFFHAGQEIGCTKFGVDNSYNKGDLYNKFDWNLFDKNYNMVIYLRSILYFRRYVCPKISDAKQIGDVNTFTNLEDGSLMVEIVGINSKFKHFNLIFNPDDEDFNYEMIDYYLILISPAGYLKNSSVFTMLPHIDANSVNLFVEK